MHWLILSCIHPSNHPYIDFINFIIPFFIHPFSHLFIPSCIYLLIDILNPAFKHPCLHSCIHAFIHWRYEVFILAFTHWRTHPPMQKSYQAHSKLIQNSFKHDWRGQFAERPHAPARVWSVHGCATRAVQKPKEKQRLLVSSCSKQQGYKVI